MSEEAQTEETPVINPDVEEDETPVDESVNQILKLGVQLGSDADADESDEAKTALPDELPILPLRGMVVYPQTAVPLTVGQPRSIQLVDDIMAGDRLVGLFASKDPELETPGPDDIHTVGTLASIHRLFRSPDGTIRLLVQGVERIEIEE